MNIFCRISLLLLGCLSLFTAIASDTLITKQSFWRYRDDSTSLGIDWKLAGYVDTTWKVGQGTFGYGKGNETTVLDFGPNPNQKYITTYFRKNIVIDSTKTYNSYSFKVKRDDGFALYINGNEVFRDNMGTGFIYYTTLAQDAKDEGIIDVKFTLPSAVFHKGENTLAIELHQSSIYTNDALFDLELVANQQPVIVHAPYLQKVSAHSTTIRWQTSTPQTASLHYGMSPNTLPFVIKDTIVNTEHIVTLENLLPYTRYFYAIDSVETSPKELQNQYVRTFPIAGTTPKTRIWATGDCGNASVNQVMNMRQQQQYLNQEAADVWLLLGDNAYESGYYAEYQRNFFDIFSSILPHTPLFPAPGNHEYAGNSDRQNDHAIAYYDVFSLPSEGECGGTPSHTESFYSYNYGGIHFLSLDSYGREDSSTRLYDTLGAQVQWIKQDLAASKEKWKIAYWHHPPYTKGSHNSDTEDELIQIRQNLLQILERYGVDLVLCGHSHSYERSVLLSGYYSDAPAYDAELHSLSTSSAHYDGSQNSCPYTKKDKGTVYIVAGSAGKVGGTQSDYPHPAMSYSDVSIGGSLMVEIEGNRLDAKWLCADGNIRDAFTMMKNVQHNDTVPVGFGQNISLHASWLGQYHWQNGSTLPSISLSAYYDSVVTVRDDWGCLEDTFLLQLPIAYPVDIDFFRADALASHQVRLAWMGSNEKNLDHFAVERSIDKLHYSVIGLVEPNVYLQYNYRDNTAPDGLVYYRIRALDTEGASFTTKPVAVYLYNETPLISLYPNPLFRNTLNISILSANSESPFSIEMIDVMGKTTMSKTPIFKGTGKYAVNISNYASGLYLVKISSDTQSWTESILIN
jgi:3',5'-cyclic AMP phosphodiesterase CpdA